MEIKSVGSQSSNNGPADWFTGTARIDPVRGSRTGTCSWRRRYVRARCPHRWHRHPLGHTLIVTSGLGWAQCWGGLIEEIPPGDVVWFAPDEKHWHGATPITTS